MVNLFTGALLGAFGSSGQLSDICNIHKEQDACTETTKYCRAACCTLSVLIRCPLSVAYTLKSGVFLIVQFSHFW